MRVDGGGCRLRGCCCCNNLWGGGPPLGNMAPIKLRVLMGVLVPQDPDGDASICSLFDPLNQVTFGFNQASDKILLEVLFANRFPEAVNPGGV